MADSDAAVAQAVFYNMTGQAVELVVNGYVKNTESIEAIPTTLPYTPAHNTQHTYQRVSGEAQENQFGKSNTVLFEAPGFRVEVTIDVDIPQYQVTNPLLIFMFQTGAVVSCPTVDSIAYVGHSGDTIQVNPSTGNRL